VTLPSTAYRGYAAPTWDTKTAQQIIDYLATKTDAYYDSRYATPAQVSARAAGLVAWIRGFATTATTTEARIFDTQVSVTAGRAYECALMNVTPDVGNTKATEFRMRYTTDGSAVTNSSAIMAISLRLSQFELGAIRAIFVPGSNLTLKLRASISSLDAANVRCWCPGDGGILAVWDQGVAPGQFGSVGP
jgi:hypothetical protein